MNRHEWVDESVKEAVKVYGCMQLVTEHIVPICM